MSNIDELDTSKNNKELMVKIIPATVVKVGNDEDEDGFSYEYEFTNPLTGEVCQAYDDLREIGIGEQIYDEGDELQIIFSERIKQPGCDKNYNVTRCVIFPEQIKKGKRKRRILKILYILFVIFISCFCTLMSINK